MPIVRSILAIGQRGQLGLQGSMPWEGQADPEYTADVAKFFELTRGHVLICGPRTKASIPDFAYADRTIVEIRSWMDPHEVVSQFPDRIVYVGEDQRSGRPMHRSFSTGTSPAFPMTGKPTGISIRLGSR